MTYSSMHYQSGNSSTHQTALDSEMQHHRPSSPSHSAAGITSAKPSFSQESDLQVAAEQLYVEETLQDKNQVQYDGAGLEAVSASSRTEKKDRFDPHAVWKMLLSELALQMPSATFNTWVRDTWVVGYEDGEFIIGLPNAYARDWLENRLRNKIKRALSSFIQRSVQVQFRVCPRTVSDAADAQSVPLYADHPTDVQTQTNVKSQQFSMPAVSELEADDFSATPDKTTPFGNGSNHLLEPQTPRQVQRQPDELVTQADNVQLPTGSTNAPIRTQQDYYAERDVLTARIPLNNQYTFETFVVGSHNKLAHAAAEAIAEQPGQSFNPLFVYGGVGLGKTHLLHSIGHRAKQEGFRMLYVSSEQFTNELIGAIRSQSTEEFRNKYRQVDILLIDDIQFISGKESTQEEFFHTFNHLHASGRQVVLSSDRPPKMLATLDDRLRSRFEGGLQTDIAQPDFETRVAILQSKANRMAAAVDHSVLMMVAERVDSNIRELEGALNRLIVQARLMHTPLTLAVATTILDNLAPERTVCSPDIVIKIVAEHFQLKADDLCGRKRTKEIAGARQIAMYLLRDEHGLSLPAIGDLLGGRDHSTVRYGIEKIAAELEQDESLRESISILRENLYTSFMH